jgi:hypothetical protein
MSDAQLRRDVYVYNESTGFVITSALQGGQWSDRLDDLKAARNAVTSGAFLPLELYQDDSFLVRVVVGGDLTADEQASWVDHFAARLQVPDGRLALCGGIDFLTGDSDEDDDFVRIVEVPPGDYRADVYTLLPGLNGYFGLEDELEDDTWLAAYWQRTRPGEEAPVWLTASESDSEGTQYIDFLVHLTPATEDIPEPVFEEDEYWLPIAINRRVPDRCPSGVPAVGPIQGEE